MTAVERVSVRRWAMAAGELLTEMKRMPERTTEIEDMSVSGDECQRRRGDEASRHTRPRERAHSSPCEAAPTP